MGSPCRITIGIFFNARREQGGLFQYAYTLIDCLSRFAPQFDFILYHATLEPLPITPTGSNWRIVEFTPNQVRLRMGIEAAMMYAAKIGLAQPIKLIPTYPQMDRDHIDLLIYVKPSMQAFLWSYPCVFPIHDLQHRMQPEFPEVSAGGEYRRREFIYNNSVPIAKAILVDSIVGCEDVVREYGADPQKVHALPYLPPAYIDHQISEEQVERVAHRYLLPDQYLFYPAAFWPHKNHRRILLALKYIWQIHGVKIPLVLAGSLRHEYSALVQLTQELDIEKQVAFLGYVPDEDLYPLYRRARALIMPTFFGPTNIPVLEAWESGCPVITSAIRGIREQVGEAGLLVNPSDEIDIAQAIWELWSSPSIRENLVRLGYQRVKEWTPRHFGERLSDILTQSVEALSQA